MVANDVDLAIQRANTIRYINTNPYTVVLIPTEEQFVAGTKKRVDLDERDEQTFYIVWGVGSKGSTGERGFSDSSSGIVRKFDFIIIGRHDAELAIGDYWKTGEQMNQVEFLFPYNGYEVKGGGTSHGGSPPNV